ncbi:AI-2E family transporter [Calidifontibacillus erzurumensis]|uniref:AI-2E family transporter n=1 Tax=Calidifontibacillus erzurumensis TaxID=2741433 RepID=A0A8J8GEM7_9BACI|nr:AI-2E family transporter [Calidifontibacillus erzurumensis]NSL51003.1 AI-2E family transporter [Calidifontibacillus erzurumensis]
MEEIAKWLQNKSLKRIFIFALIILVLYSMKSMINFILLTFIFSFLMDRLVTFVSRKLPINWKVIVLIMYTAIVGLLTWGIVKYLPIIIVQIKALFIQVTAFYQQPQDNRILNYLFNVIDKNEISQYLEQGFTFVMRSFSDISHLALQIFLALLLSLFYLLEKPRLVAFTKKIKYSKLAPIYNEIEFFGGKFIRTFGKVLEAQFIIAVVNCFLSTVALYFMGFPQLFGLSIMIFFLGLIPVAGVIISLIPLCLIAYSIGGIIKVVYVLVMIALIHAVEAYILNPKLMSSKTDLPIFYTFIVLIFSEHFFGVWGLIIGIPVFVFLLDVFEVTKVDDQKVGIEPPR